MEEEKFYNTDIQEQETIINVNYGNKTATFYTCRKTVYNRMLKELGAN